MEIVSMKWDVLEIPLRKPFKIAFETMDTYRGVIVKICTEEYCGYGEAAPAPRITGDTVESTVAALKRFKPLIIGRNPVKIGKIMDDLNSSLLGTPSAKAAIDFALYDILAQKLEVPLKDILGGKKDKIETSLTVDIGDLNYTLQHARKLLDAGAKVLKVKIGLNPDEDIERVRAIRKMTDAKIRVDGNQGYSLKRAMKVLREIEKFEIEFAEQPIPASEIDNLKILRESVDIPIIADESVHDSLDVLRLIGKVDGINIKLMKSGGIYEAMKMASIARAAGMKIMVGCMIETKVGITAGTHFALGIGADYADLDGYWDLTKQPYLGVEYRDGYNYVPDKPGLGVTPQ
ncbi:dipeptide epimerase [Candidatus Aciduliprofundum boonei]|uniref:Mandelate racemase/muconate lactonizing protein n=1 Tax=Aciduliprofundum boonei (strain DSM 19572 / T469) TaxID=439481 RepID=D3TBT4_ACIB4|nr:dipeptide epimerase [Candidatus Aciduliprofundum boonei]ADD08019.1 Mandelate racemase/muconate lactonizing protein [Aciduliprofundum boonei T469]